jgi:hypothetical protein
MMTYKELQAVMVGVEYFKKDSYLSSLQYAEVLYKEKRVSGVLYDKALRHYHPLCNRCKMYSVCRVFCNGGGYIEGIDLRGKYVEKTEEEGSNSK